MSDEPDYKPYDAYCHHYVGNCHYHGQYPHSSGKLSERSRKHPHGSERRKCCCSLLLYEKEKGDRLNNSNCAQCYKDGAEKSNTRVVLLHTCRIRGTLELIERGGRKSIDVCGGVRLVYRLKRACYVGVGAALDRLSLCLVETLEVVDHRVKLFLGFVDTICRLSLRVCEVFSGGVCFYRCKHFDRFGASILDAVGVGRRRKLALGFVADRVYLSEKSFLLRASEMLK